MKIYVHGRDYINWAIDEDNKKTTEFLTELFPSCKVVSVKGKYSRFKKLENLYNIITSDIIHSVYYEQLGRVPACFIKNKKIVACISNEYKVDKPVIKKLNPFVSGWILYTKNDLKKACENGLKAFWNPLFLDNKIWFKSQKSKSEICSELGIDYNIIKDKFVISSIQKDSESSDPTKPKPQKGPDILIEILTKLKNKDKVIVLLAGPLRNYIIGKLKENNIEYLYYGEDENGLGSSQPRNIVNLIYNLTDCYVVSSRSESGPKAIGECMISKTNIISSIVGSSPDFLPEQCLYSDTDAAARMLDELIENPEKKLEIIEYNYNRVNEINSPDKQKERLFNIYKELFNIN